MKSIKMLSAALTVGLLASAPWAAAPKGQFSVLGDGTVKDNKTGLTWQQQAQYGSQGYTWDAAKTYCSSLNLGSFSSGWRLPSRFELETLVDIRATSPNPAIDQTAFPGTPSKGFWTAMPRDAAYAWVVYFSVASSEIFEQISLGRWVRCVR